MDPLEKDKKDIKELNELLDQAINEVLQDTSSEFNINTDPNAEPDYGYYGSVDSPDTFDLGKYNKTPKAEEKNPRFHGDSTSSTKRFEGPFTGRDKKPVKTINWTEQFDQLEKEMKEQRANNEKNVRTMQNSQKEPSYQFTPNQVNMPAQHREQSYQHPSDQQRYNQASERRPDTDDTASTTPRRQTKRIIERPYHVEKSEIDGSRETLQEPGKAKQSKEDILNQKMKEYLSSKDESTSTHSPQSKRIMFNNEYFQREVTKPPRSAEGVERDSTVAKGFQQQRSAFQQTDVHSSEQEEEVPEKKLDKKPEYFEYQGKKCTTTDPGGTILNCPAIVRRNVWGALPSMKQLTPMKPPAEAVVFSLNTETPSCRDASDCMRKVKEIQARHMGRDLGDIQYNFLVGGDGQLYEGRGWGYESGAERKPGEGPNLNVAFIGNYSDSPNQIPTEMITPVHDLVMWAKVNKMVASGAVRQELLPPKSAD